MKTIITDIDECVLEWDKGFCEYARSLGINNTECHTKFRTVEEWTGLNSEDAYNMVYDFNHSPYFENLKAGYQSDVYLPLLHSFGFNIIAITACGNEENVVKMRENNLNNLFPGIFSKIICVGLNESKEKYISKYPKDTWWIEDRMDNSKLGLKYDHNCLLVHQNHNSDTDHENITRVSNWSDIYEIIMKTLNTDMEN